MEPVTLFTNNENLDPTTPTPRKKKNLGKHKRDQDRDLSTVFAAVKLTDSPVKAQRLSYRVPTGESAPDSPETSQSSLADKVVTVAQKAKTVKEEEVKEAHPTTTSLIEQRYRIIIDAVMTDSKEIDNTFIQNFQSLVNLSQNESFVTFLNNYLDTCDQEKINNAAEKMAQHCFDNFSLADMRADKQAKFFIVKIFCSRSKQRSKYQFFAAAFRGDIWRIKEYLSYEFDPMTKNKQGFTPAHMGLLSNTLMCVEDLLKSAGFKIDDEAFKDRFWEIVDNHCNSWVLRFLHENKYIPTEEYEAILAKSREESSKLDQASPNPTSMSSQLKTFKTLDGSAIGCCFTEKAVTPQFLEVIFKQGIQYVVMLNATSKNLSNQYWSDTGNTSMAFGNFEVRKKSDTFSHPMDMQTSLGEVTICERVLEITDKKTGVSKQFCHYQLMNWPKGELIDSYILANLIYLLNNKISLFDIASPQLLVHCDNLDGTRIFLNALEGYREKPKTELGETSFSVDDHLFTQKIISDLKYYSNELYKKRCATDPSEIFPEFPLNQFELLNVLSFIKQSESKLDAEMRQELEKIYNNLHQNLDFNKELFNKELFVRISSILRVLLATPIFIEKELNPNAEQALNYIYGLMQERADRRHLLLIISKLSPKLQGALFNKLVNEIFVSKSATLEKIGAGRYLILELVANAMTTIMPRQGLAFAFAISGGRYGKSLEKMKELLKKALKRQSKDQLTKAFAMPNRAGVTLFQAAAACNNVGLMELLLPYTDTTNMKNLSDYLIKMEIAGGNGSLNVERMAPALKFLLKKKIIQMPA